MSLIHWWSLDGDTEDKIGGITLTNNAATVRAAKTGLGYYFNGSANLKQNYEQTKSFYSYFDCSCCVFCFPLAIYLLVHSYSKRCSEDCIKFT